jgi:hypothetical protein
MNCFAIWYKHKLATPKERLEVELHLNLWKLKLKEKKRGNNYKHFLDIGIRIEDPSNISIINIYSPIKIKRDEIQDLGKYFQDNNKLVAAIFNEQWWSIKSSSHSKTLQIEDDNNRIQFYIYMIDVENDVRINSKYGGSIIRLKVKGDAHIKPIYYRIRITSDKLEGLSTSYKPESPWLESHFTNTELIDFRINENRNLDKSLLEEMHRDGEIHFFKTVDLFIMREYKYDYIYSHKERIRSRRLEDDLWDSYVDADCECANIIAYHWKFGNIPGFNAFVKYKFITSDILTRTGFIIFLLFIAFMGAVLGAFAMELFSKWFS